MIIWTIWASWISPDATVTKHPSKDLMRYLLIDLDVNLVRFSTPANRSGELSQIRVADWLPPRVGQEWSRGRLLDIRLENNIIRFLLHFRIDQKYFLFPIHSADSTSHCVVGKWNDNLGNYRGPVLQFCPLQKSPGRKSAPFGLRAREEKEPITDLWDANSQNLSRHDYW